MQRFVFFFVTLLFLLIATSSARAQSPGTTGAEPVVLTDQKGEYPLGLHLEILEDPSGELTIEDVTSPEFDSKFTPSAVPVPIYGFTDSAFWVRFQVDNRTGQTGEWLLEQGFANTHYVDLYTPLPQGQGFAVKQTGLLRPSTSRDITHPRFIFRLAIPSQGQQTIYLRFQSGASMTLPLTLWTQKAFLNDALLQLIASGIFFGVLIGLLFYNLFLVFSLREASFLYFVILMASLIFEEASYDGYLGLSLTPSLYLLNKYLEPLSFSLLMASMLLFSDAFLELKTRLPKLHWANLAILAGWGGLVLLTPFVRYRSLANLAIAWALVTLLAAFTAGIVSWRRGFRPARFFMVAWFGLLGTIILVVLVRLGLTPSTFFSENAYRLGYLWMAVLWSIALADRVNLLKAETERANRDLRDSEHRLSQILEGLPLGVILYGKDQKPKYANRRTVEILSDPVRGIQPDLSIGRTLREAIPYFSLKAAGSQQEYILEHFPVFNALQGTQASADDIEMERGDKRVALEIQASPVRDDAGNVESAVVAIQDITQRKQAEVELAEYRQDLESLVDERTQELDSANEQLRLRVEWLSAVNNIHQTIGGASGLPKAYEDLSAKIIALLGAKLVFVVQWSDQSEQPEAFCYSLPGAGTHNTEALKAGFEKGSPLRRDVERGNTISWSADQAASVPLPLRQCFEDPDIQSSILEPLFTRHSVTGVLGVSASAPAEKFLSQHASLIERMAFDLADLSQDAVLLDQALVLATTEERNRLARDLHDSVTQALFSATLLAEVLPQIWRRDPEKALPKLDRLRHLTRGALAEMRTLLLELRPAAVVNMPLGDLLTQLTEAAASRSELPFQLDIEQIPPLPADVHANFYRIAQEALNNVAKHAQAEGVIVSISAAPLSPEANGDSGHEFILVIEDDGVGFPAWNEQLAGLGIGIMRERAAAIGGTLSLESQPGHGTRVTLTWCSELESKA